jgi:hypothetical protein
MFSVTKLNDVRDDNTTYNNRLDTTLADVFNLLSLFYLTIGKTRDTPAIYSQIASMRVGVTSPNSRSSIYALILSESAAQCLFPLQRASKLIGIALCSKFSTT